MKISKQNVPGLIINDNVNIAKQVNANGIHIGKTDMHPAEARKVLGNNFIVFHSKQF